MIEKEVVVIGGGQAALAIGYYLQQNDRDFVILDANPRTGDSWRNRYDSLVLFTPRMYCSLPGMPFPGAQDGLPAKDEAADYLEGYAQNFSLPVVSNAEVSLLQKRAEGFYVRSHAGEFRAQQVVVATGPFQHPVIPAFAASLSPDIYQVHSSAYRNPAQLNDGSVLVVGAGNSGAQIAVELAREREVTISSSHRLSFRPLQIWGKSIFWYFNTLGLLQAGPASRRGRWLRRQAEQIYGLELKEEIEAGRVQVKTRALQAEGRTISFEGGSQLVVNNVIWATGFRSDYKWMDIPGALGSNGIPKHEEGVSPVEGMYFVGLPWQSGRGSALLGWVSRDAESVTRHITAATNTKS
ncbi:flavin-containing monooxygenase [Paenibacillus lutrae]|uniref:SidA/IucD/PvdA family monooxygenase n=1 Tax=Paenibacillus lutrae TaxID=2078573 RepID=A0A7X3FHY1_9BACL|nr:NAD(P)/FAD-dependent oxidoreductase [Paenibacillus lutrae]MVO99951.1 SidA/IucD/PvdA family monooxygenase [Paenibacillus lutrae]